MPVLQLMTNVKVTPHTFIPDLVSASASILNKDRDGFTVTYRHDPNLYFGGSFAPAFILTIFSLDNLSPEANETYSAELAAFLDSRLGVPSDRGYIAFIDPGRAYMGYEGTTFATLWGPK